MMKLGYWDIRGLAAPIRMLLEYTKTPYEEDRYTASGEAPNWDVSSWLSVKETFGLDFPNLPYLIDGQVKLTQQNAILRYIARKHNMCGSSEIEMAHCDMLEHELLDFKNKFVSLCYSPHFNEKRAGYVDALPTSLARFEKFLGNKQWLVGDNLTYVDFVLYENLDQHLLFEPACLNDFPKLKSLWERFGALPAIAAYKKSPKYIERPCNNKMAAWK